MLLHTVISKIRFSTPSCRRLTFFAYILSFLILAGSGCFDFLSMYSLMRCIIFTKHIFFGRISRVTDIFEMLVVSMLFQIGFRRPGSVGFWTPEAVVNLMSIPIVFQPLAFAMKFQISYLTICIMANSNMIFQLIFVVIYVRSFITLIKWCLWFLRYLCFLQMLIEVSLEIFSTCANNVSKFSN